jgi:hypothetical protein
MHIMKTALYANVDKNRELRDWVIEPQELAGYPLMKFCEHEEEFFNIGYAHARHFAREYLGGQ